MTPWKGSKFQRLRLSLISFFIDDVFCSVNGSLRDVSELKWILDLYFRAIGMLINLEKSCVIINKWFEAEDNSFLSLILAQRRALEARFKYLGFHLKPDRYRKEDWGWLIHKVEVRISVWTNKLLSRGGRLVLIKSVLEGIPVYWNSIAVIPKGILDKIHRLSFKYLWSGNNIHGG